MSTVERDGKSSGGGPRERLLADAFVDMADTLVADYDVLDFLHGLAGHCVELLDVDAAGLMLADRSGTLRVAASSTEQVRLLELFELQNEEGPCLECFGSGAPVANDDLDADGASRWPRFSREALSAGFRSVVALPMRLRDETIGALNLFRAEPGPLLDPDRSLAQALADVATIGSPWTRYVAMGRRSGPARGTPPAGPPRRAARRASGRSRASARRPHRRGRRAVRR